MSVQNFTEVKAQSKTFDLKRIGYLLRAVVSADGLICTCEYAPGISGPPMTEDELRGFLEQSKIREGIDEEAIEMILAKAAAREKVTNTVIARGDSMIPGKDGHFEFCVSRDEEHDEESDHVDLRKVLHFLNVCSGQLIGVIRPPGEGTPGRNVFGVEIPAQRGKELHIRLGKQTRLDEDGVTIYSEADGQIFYYNDEISVEDTFTIKGDVDFKVGNINYNGFLDVRGDVLDGFIVKATKGIKLQGNIGTGTVESDGDIKFCGMAGQDKGIIRCGGNIIANFIHDTVVECEGDVIVETEIRNCDIKCNGIVRVNKGVLVGGNCIALGGVEVATAGSPSSLTTRIVVGVNFHDQDECNRLFNELKKVIEVFKASKDRSNTDELMKKRKEITANIQEVRSRFYENANAKVNVKRRLFEKVNLTFVSVTEEIKEERMGPLTMIANTVEGGVRYLPMTDLSIKASDMEEKYVQEAEKRKQSE